MSRPTAIGTPPRWRPGDPPPWPGATVVCCASGPSLTPADCAWVRGRAPLIAVNDAVRLAPFAEVLYSSDRGWWAREQGRPTFAGAKVTIGSAIGLADPLAPDILVLRYTGIDGLERDPAGLRCGRNSGYAAMNLAVHLGARRIVLLGYDLRPRQGRMHYAGAPPGVRPTSASLFAVWGQHFHTLRLALDAFPRGALREALPGRAA